MAYDYTILKTAETYFQKLDQLTREGTDCYEVTLLDGMFQGTKLLIGQSETGREIFCLDRGGERENEGAEAVIAGAPEEGLKRKPEGITEAKDSKWISEDIPGAKDSKWISEDIPGAKDFKWIPKDILETKGLFEGAFPGVRKTPLGNAFVEKAGGGQHLIICGAGHVSMALIRVAKMVGFQVTVIDDRPAFADNARKAGADQVICEPFGPVLRAMADGDAPYYVIVTRGHQYDVDCMHEILKKKHSYIGMMGSRVRVKNLKKRLLDEGFDEKLLDSVHMPIGLKIGAATPEEIAVSIVAELIQCRRNEAEKYHYSKEMMAVLCARRAEKALDAKGELPDGEYCPMGRALAMIVVKKGSGPREAGTKMIVMEDGRIVGTIGGGCAEAAVIQKARYCIRQRCCSMTHVDMTGAEAAENGLVCGGIMDVFIQPL